MENSQLTLFTEHTLPVADENTYVVGNDVYYNKTYIDKHIIEHMGINSSQLYKNREIIFKDVNPTKIGTVDLYSEADLDRAMENAKTVNVPVRKPTKYSIINDRLDDISDQLDAMRYVIADIKDRVVDLEVEKLAKIKNV